MRVQEVVRPVRTEDAGIAAEGLLSRTMAVSLFPNGLGQTQPRLVSLAGDTLRLGTASPIRSGGREIAYHLRQGAAAATAGRQLKPLTHPSAAR